MTRITSDPAGARAHLRVSAVHLVGIILALLLGGSASANDVVARLEVEVPEHTPFFLRGTVPVPPETWVDGQPAPLSILGPGGVMVETQCEVVSRYAKREQGADVIEVIARVERPANASVGDRIRYRVVHAQSPPGDHDLSPGVEDLLATPGALRITSNDLRDRTFAADLRTLVAGSAPNLRRDGQLVREHQGHRILLAETPEEGPEGTLPHLMGVHAWVRSYDQTGYMLIDLHVHNGMDGRNATDPRDDLLDRIYFRDLNIDLPAPWRVVHAFEHPLIGDHIDVDGLRRHPLLKRRGEKAYLMPRQSRMARRIAIALPGWEERAQAALQEEGLGFCVRGMSPTSSEPLWSWWNVRTARYFPQKHRLPEVDHLGLDTLRSSFTQKLNQYSEQIRTGSKGTYPFISVMLGWAHPWGVAYGGMTGGDEIFPWEGFLTAGAASRDGYRYHQLRMRAYTDRCPTSLYRLNGRHTRVSDLILDDGFYGPYFLTGFFLRPHKNYGFYNAPKSQLGYVRDHDLDERWHESLERWQAIDFQHYIRYTKDLKALCWLGNDSLAEHLLVSAAEVFHLSFHRYTAEPYGYVPGSGLLKKMQYVEADPQEGVPIGRGEAWGLDAVAAAYSVGDADWRERKVDWLNDVTSMIINGQTCRGAIQAQYFGSLLGGRFIIWRANESAYLDHAIVGIQESVYRDEFPERTAELDDVIVASARTGLTAPYYNWQTKSVHNSVGVGAKDPIHPVFCDHVPNQALGQYMTSEHSYNSIAFAYQRSGDPFFLERASRILGGDAWDRLHQDGLFWIENRAALLALMQSIGD